MNPTDNKVIGNDNRAAEAEPLLEAASAAAPDNDSLKVALASCLLTQEKEPERATRLLEEVVNSPGSSGQGAGAPPTRPAGSLATPGRSLPAGAARKPRAASTRLCSSH